MHFTARVNLFAYYTALFLLAFLFLAIIPLLTKSPVFAQNRQSPMTSQEIPVRQYAQTNLDSDVPLDMHTRVQALFIELIAGASCLLTGVDPINPQQGCLDINPQTGKLAYSTPVDGKAQVGGMLGLLPGMFAAVYTPPISTSDHIRYLASNFGIVEPVHAQAANGFQQLEPIQGLWVAMRNITYLVFVFIFIIIGLGIILRIKIDPRTVMTLQNQIPRIIICILLITFSYAIVGFMIDIMWNVTHMGLNVVTGAAGTATGSLTNPEGCTRINPLTKAEEEPSLLTRAEETLLNTPLGFGNIVLQGYSQSSDGIIKCNDGIWAVSITVAKTIGSLIEGLVNMMLGASMDGAVASNCSWANFFTIFGEGVKFSDCFAKATGLSPGLFLGAALGWLGKITAVIIILCVVVWNLIRIWFQITRAYVMVILYAISGPLWIILGLLPSKPLGFEKWFRRIFANLVIFPATALLITLAGIMMNAFNQIEIAPVPGTAGPGSPNMFVPPLVGQPNMDYFGTLLAFGILLVTPGLLDIIRSSMSAVGKQGQMAVGSISSTMAQGSAYPRGVGRGAWSRTMGYNSRTGHAGIGLQVLAGQVTPGKSNVRNTLVNWLAGAKAGTIKRGGP